MLQPVRITDGPGDAGHALDDRILRARILHDDLGLGPTMSDAEEKAILLERLKERLAVVRGRLSDYTRGKRPWFEADCREAEELFVDIRRLEPGFERRD